MRLLETLTKMMALTLTVLGLRNGDCAEFPQMLIFYLSSVENANVNVFMDLLFWRWECHAKKDAVTKYNH